MPTLLQRIAAGDASAVDQALDSYGGLVWRLANRYLDRAQGEVEDAVQEVFVELWLKASAFDPELGQEAAFVATIAHRRLIDYQRRVTARRKVERKAIAETLRSVSSETRNDVSSQELATAFDELPEVERQTLWMSIHHGMTSRQIGIALDTSANTIKSRQRRGLARLVEALKPGRRDASKETSA